MVLGFPGFGRNDQPMPGSDPVLPPGLVGPYAAAQASDIQTGAQHQAFMSGNMEQNAKIVIEGVLTKLAQSAIHQMDRAEAGLQGFVDERHPQRASTKASHPNPVPGTGHTSPGEVPEGAPPPQHVPTVSERYREGRSQIQGQSMGSIAKAVSAPASRYLSERTGGWVHTDPDATKPGVLNSLPDGQQGYYRLSEDGVVQDGSLAAGSVAESHGMRSMTGAKIRAGGFVASNLSAFSTGEGMAMGRLGTFAARAAGPIGIGVGLAAAGGNFLEKQQEEAASYRAAFGEEGTGMFAAQDRFAEWRAGLQGFGTIGGDRARAQFQQASALGLRGDRREQATDFATDMYKRLGIDTEASMAMVRQSIETGNASLASFSEAISEVARSSVEAGRTASEGVEGFLAVQQTMAGRFGGGPSTQIAANIGQVAGGFDTSLLESIGGIEGLGNSLTNQTIMTMSAMSGQAPMAAIGQMFDPSRAGETAAGVVGLQGQQLVAYLASLLGRSESAFRREVSVAEISSEQDLYNVLREMAGSDEHLGMTMITVLEYAQSVLGFAELDQGSVLKLIYEALQNEFGATPDQAKAGKAVGAAVADIVGSMPFVGRTARDGYQKAPDAQTGTLHGQTYAARGPAAGAAQEAQNANRLKVLGNLGMTGQYAGMAQFDDQEAFDAYLGYVNRGGGQNKTIEALLDPKNRAKILGSAGAGDLSDVRFRVNGEDMSLAGAISDPSALSEIGSAGIVGQKNNLPQSISVVLDLTPDARSLVKEGRGPSDDQRDGVPARRSDARRVQSYGAP